MPNERWGNVSAKPASVSSVDSVYSVAGGTIDLDLSSLPQVGTVRTNVSVGLGNVSVIVPPDADVELTCSAGVGSVECLGQNQNAMDAQVRVTDTGTDGPGGLRIVLDARANSGTVEVRRG
jgi:predicted membrane protein